LWSRLTTVHHQTGDDDTGFSTLVSTRRRAAATSEAAAPPQLPKPPRPGLRGAIKELDHDPGRCCCCYTS